jgi:anaerobic selenocysteine-containing dehydrogenase
MRRGDPDVGSDRAPRRAVNMNELGALLCGELSGPPAAVLFVQGSNPAVTCPDQRAVLRGLARDDLFTVVHDQVLTDTAALADVVLPAPTHLEVDDLVSSYGSFTLQRSRPVVGRVGEGRSNDEVSAALAARFGWAGDFDPDAGRLIEAAVLDGDGDAPARVLRPPGGTVQFVHTFPPGPSRRARLHHPGSDLPLPRYADLDEAVTAAYPLTLVSPATSRTINSILGESDPPAAVVAVHPQDALARGLDDGALVEVDGPSATIVLPCRVDGDLRPGVCMIPKGLWRRHVVSGLTANALVPGTISDLAGGACFNDARVEIRGIADPAEVRPTREGA